MPHEHIELAQTPNGEIGPRCKTCGIRLTFGEAMVVDKNYLCWEHYVESTGADTATVENNNAFDEIDLLSNGFKLRSTGSYHNSSGETYIFMAFAESPFQTANAK